MIPRTLVLDPDIDPHGWQWHDHRMAGSFDWAVAERYIKQAYPHESGHILVGRLLGLKVSGLAHEVIRGRNNEILPGNFITASMAPPSPEVV